MYMLTPHGGHGAIPWYTAICHTAVLTRVSGISGYHVQTVHSARYSVYGRPHAHSRRTRAVSGHVQALRSMQSRLAAPRIHQVGCPSKADERATTAMSMLQRSTAAAQQARTAAPLRRRTDHSHHADQPCAAGAWKTSLAAPRRTRCWATLHTDHTGPLSSNFSRSSQGPPSNFSRSSGPSVKLWPP